MTQYADLLAELGAQNAEDLTYMTAPELAPMPIIHAKRLIRRAVEAVDAERGPPPAPAAGANAERGAPPAPAADDDDAERRRSCSGGGGEAGSPTL